MTLQPQKTASPYVFGATVGFFGGILLCGVLQLLLPNRKNQSDQQERSRRPLDNLHHLDDRILRRSQSLSQQNSFSSVDEGAEEGDSSESSSVSENVYQIVLTGGPCAGKSSAIEFFTTELRALGYVVYQVPEVPTLLLNGGCVYPGMNGGKKLIQFEVALMELQLQMEQTFYKIATKAAVQYRFRPSPKGSVILYDRGLLDIAAFVPRTQWDQVVNHSEWVRDGLLGVIDRYDLILHLVSAANGAEQHYKIKKESLSEARKLDRNILSCYRGHRKHVVIDNSTGFQKKLERGFQHVLEVLET